VTRRGTRGSGKTHRELIGKVGHWGGRSERSMGRRTRTSRKTSGRRGKRAGSGANRVHGTWYEYWWGNLK
jgi:hypothetical protein